MELDFHIPGLEDATVAAIQEIASGYAVALYDGELEGESDLRTLVSKLRTRLPAVFVSYAGGRSTRTAPTGMARAEEYTHNCTINVIACANDRRGGQERRRGMGESVGVFQMAADVNRALIGRQFVTDVDGKRVALNTEPLRPRQGEDNFRVLANLTGLTAVLLPFDTAFKFMSTDWSITGPRVREFYFDLDSLNRGGVGSLPGVHVAA